LRNPRGELGAARGRQSGGAGQRHGVARVDRRSKDDSISRRGPCSQETFIGRRRVSPRAGIDIMHVPFKRAPECGDRGVRGPSQRTSVPLTVGTRCRGGKGARARRCATPQSLDGVAGVPTFREAGLDFVLILVRVMTRRECRRCRAKLPTAMCGDMQSPEVKTKFAAPCLPRADTPEGSTASFSEPLRSSRGVKDFTQ